MPRRSSSRTTVSKGNPITLLTLPSTPSTKTPPAPWIAYAPALSNGSPVARYHSTASGVSGTDPIVGTYGHPGVHLMGPARQALQHPDGVVGVDRLAEDLAVELDHRVGGEDRVAVDRTGLLGGQPGDQLQRALAVSWGLVDPVWRDDTKRHAEQAQQLTTAGRRRSENQRHAASRGIAAGSAQRIVRVTASPPKRSTVASLTGSHGSRSGQRAQRGSSDTAATAIGA
jgi:hypothetical protein